MYIYIQVLSKGVGILVAEADAVWTGDPLRTLPPDAGADGAPWDFACGCASAPPPPTGARARGRLVQQRQHRHVRARAHA